MDTNDSSAAAPADAAAVAAQCAEWDAHAREYHSRWARYHERRSAALPRTKAAIFDALEAAGIAQITIEFEDSGDCGQMELATAINGDEQTLEIPNVSVEITEVDFHEAKETLVEASLRDAIETIAYELLEQTHDGWENNDGGFGVFTFDVAKRSITLDFDERYTETNKYVHEF